MKKEIAEKEMFSHRKNVSFLTSRHKENVKDIEMQLKEAQERLEGKYTEIRNLNEKHIDRETKFKEK